MVCVVRRWEKLLHFGAHVCMSNATCGLHVCVCKCVCMYVSKLNARSGCVCMHVLVLVACIYICAYLGQKHAHYE